MKQKNGFTLVEVLVVIAILAIIMTLSSIAVLGVLKNNDEKLKQEMEKNLQNAGIAYIQEKKISLRKCSVGFNPQSPNAAESSCYKTITVQDLLDSGLFTDNANYCNKEQTIIIYRATENEYSENRAYVKEGTCK